MQRDYGSEIKRLILWADRLMNWLKGSPETLNLDELECPPEMANPPSLSESLGFCPNGGVRRMGLMIHVADTFESMKREDVAGEAVEAALRHIAGISFIATDDQYMTAAPGSGVCPVCKCPIELKTRAGSGDVLKSHISGGKECPGSGHPEAAYRRVLNARTVKEYQQKLGVVTNELKKVESALASAGVRHDTNKPTGRPRDEKADAAFELLYQKKKDQELRQKYPKWRQRREHILREIVLPQFAGSDSKECTRLRHNIITRERELRQTKRPKTPTNKILPPSTPESGS